MKIREILWSHRNDFRAVIECEFCNSCQTLRNGYNDEHYYSKVLPSIPCKACGRSTLPLQEGVSPVDVADEDIVRLVEKTVSAWEIVS